MIIGKEEADGQMNYMVLVNKQNPLPEDWGNDLETLHTLNGIGEDIIIERNAFQAYLGLKEDLEREGIPVDLDSAFRSLETQRQIMMSFTETYGADYAAKTVAQPGFSEHHTGLALDLLLVIDNRTVILNEELVSNEVLWERIHPKLPAYGFILRYPAHKEHITGYAYEPWHIRYVNSLSAAEIIMDQKITLEEYLGAAEDLFPEIHLGESSLYSEEVRREGTVLIKCELAAWKNCMLERLTYTGDEMAEKEKQMLNRNAEDGEKYTGVMVFRMDCRSAEKPAGILNPDQGKFGYLWRLGCSAAGVWKTI